MTAVELLAFECDFSFVHASESSESSNEYLHSKLKRERTTSRCALQPSRGQICSNRLKHPLATESESATGPSETLIPAISRVPARSNFERAFTARNFEGSLTRSFNQRRVHVTHQSFPEDQRHIRDVKYTRCGTRVYKNV